MLAANPLAKKFLVRTGDAVWQARQKCRELVVVPPDYDEYLRVSRAALQIYGDISPQVEPFGLDECWIGTDTLDFREGQAIADRIRARTKAELGITASVGVSDSKVIAKLASDIRKPDATTVITPDNFEQVVWPLPVSDLLYVGRATTAKLTRYGIDTIGRLARTDPEFLRRLLKSKRGIDLWRFANNLDETPVALAGSVPTIKSIGNSTTTPRDLTTVDDMRITVFLLSESVAERLRDGKFKCRTVQVWIRYSDLSGLERQAQLPFPSCTAQRIGDLAAELVARYAEPGRAVRSLGVRACNLIHDEYPQLSLLPEIQAEQRQEDLEYALDHLRRRYGNFSVRRGMMLADPQLSDLSPKDDHTIHPAAFFK